MSKSAFVSNLKKKIQFFLRPNNLD